MLERTSGALLVIFLLWYYIFKKKIKCPILFGFRKNLNVGVIEEKPIYFRVHDQIRYFKIKSKTLVVVGQWIACVVSFKKMIGLCGLKGHIVGKRKEVTFVGSTDN